MSYWAAHYQLTSTGAPARTPNMALALSLTNSMRRAPVRREPRRASFPVGHALGRRSRTSRVHRPDANAGIAWSRRELVSLNVSNQTAAAVDFSDFALNRTWHNGDPSATTDRWAIHDDGFPHPSCASMRVEKPQVWKTAEVSRSHWQDCLNKSGLRQDRAVVSTPKLTFNRPSERNLARLRTPRNSAALPPTRATSRYPCEPTNRMSSPLGHCP